MGHLSKVPWINPVFILFLLLAVVGLSGCCELFGNCDEDDNGPTGPEIDCEIDVQQPHTGDSWTAGSSESVEWGAEGDDCSSTVKIELYKGSTLLCVIAPSTVNDGQYWWTVDCCGGGDGSDYRIKVTDLENDEYYDYGDYFTLNGCGGDCTINVTMPDGDPPPWYEGEMEWIYWDSEDTSGHVKLELYHDGAFLCTMDPSIVDDGSHPWTVDACGHTSSWMYQIKITDVNDSSCYGFSPYFGIDFP